MAKRRQFVGAALFTALLCIGLWRLFHWPARIPPAVAQNLVRVWLAADYREAGQDPLLRGPTDPNATSSAGAEELSPIAFTAFETVRPWIKPNDAAHAALARVEIRFQGGPPPDGEAVRYFLLVQKAGGAWQVRREISESAYRWRLGQ